MKAFLAAVVVLFLLLREGEGKLVNISNVEPRRDTTGEIMDIHDGNTLLIGDTYYYYGASYGSCVEPKGTSGCANFSMGACGFREDHNVSVFTSPDLETWTFAGHVFEMANAPVGGILWCPKVIYNKATFLYVLWYNYLPQWNMSHSLYATAISPSPYGPFKVVNINVTLAYTFTGDFNLFLDDDGQGYIIYTSHIHGWNLTHQMSIERLTPDFTGSVPSTNTGYFGEVKVEAPALFKRNNVYFAVFGPTCCFCQEGSGVTAYYSTKPLGPYTATQVITAAIPSQQTNIATIETKNGTAYLWQGDRWQTAPDGQKGHDLSYWGLLTFSSDTDIVPLKWEDSFQIQMPN